MTHRFEAASKRGEVDKVAAMLERHDKAFSKSVVRILDTSALRAKAKQPRSTAVEDEVEDMWDNVPV